VLSQNTQETKTPLSPWSTAIAHNDKPIYGIQFHPEVTHSLRGKDVLRRFVTGSECNRSECDIQTGDSSGMPSKSLLR
jgi:hypothetical protein